jgi:SHS2 domain-containing protein
VETFELEAEDQDALLVAWLDELLYNFYTKQLIFFKFKVEELTEKRLKVKATGRPVGANRNRLKTEIKAATYSGLNIRKSGKGYEVEIIFDV